MKRHVGWVEFDRYVEHCARALVARSSRRTVIARLGALLFVSSGPLLPILRGQAAEPENERRNAAQALPGYQLDPKGHTEFERTVQKTDDRACNYWRYCAIDGNLCTCCGGGVHTCPPGSVPSPTAWIGTCLNPDDGASYLIAYRDCCGKSACGQCLCDNSDRETPVYRATTNNDIIWCVGLANMTYHCSTAVLVGKAE